MRRRARVLAFWVLVFVGGCNPTTVRTDYDVTADFSKYRTFNYVGQAGPQESTRSLPGGAFLDQRIRRAVSDTLAAKGYAFSEGESDFLIAHHLNVQNRQDLYVYGYRYWGPTDVYVDEYKRGSLILDFVDAKTNQLFWRGWATQDIYYEARDADSAQKRINDVVGKMLKDFPPQ